jgi:ABC-type transporter Mla maintaining outer membrane lipid asymmetry permease subunit MlaE
MIFSVVALIAGYLCGVILQVPALAGSQFVTGVFNSLRPIDMLLFGGKTLLPGMVTGAVCCIYGLKVEPVLTAVPQAATRAAVASTWALFLVVGVGSVLTMFL